MNAAVCRRSITIRPCFALVLSFLLAACQPSPTAQPHPATPLVQPTSTFIESSHGTPTSSLPPEQSGLPNTSSNPASDLPQTTAIPLRFTFPTPGPEAENHWRPPLYSVPWALGPYDHFYFTRPIAADQVNWPLANYRYGYIWEGATLVHTGIDIDAEPGTPVHAAGPGTVMWAGYGVFYNKDDPTDPYGNAVSIKHDFGYNGKSLYTIYGHMERVDVIRGQHVEAGDLIGIVGSTGKSTGPHLHLEVRMEQNNYYATFNPELWLAPPQGWGVLTGRVMDDHGNLLTEAELTVTSLDTGKQKIARTYGQYGVNGDQYYNENLVLADLPAGEYRLGYEIKNDKDETLRSYLAQITIRPGAITYFTFTDKTGFETDARPLVVESDLWTEAGNP